MCILPSPSIQYNIDSIRLLNENNVKKIIQKNKDYKMYTSKQCAGKDEKR